MKTMPSPTRRKLLHRLCGVAVLPFLSSCGTIIYPERVHQKERGNLDPAVVILDGIGLFFFLIPGVIAFAVDFGTGAIFYPADHEPGDPEETIFDEWHDEAVMKSGMDQRAIEKFIRERTGKSVRLDEAVVRVREMERLDQFEAFRSALTHPSTSTAG